MRGGQGTAAELYGLATAVYDLWATDFATDPRALVHRRWAESTVFAWARELRGVAGLLYAEQSHVCPCTAPGTLGNNGEVFSGLTVRYISSCMARKLQLLRPTVCPIHCAIAAGAGWAYNSEACHQVWGTLGMLRTMATAIRSVTYFAVLALAVFSVCHGLRVGEAASMRRADVSQPSWIGFYCSKSERRWIPARLGVWAKQWRQALLACGIVQRSAQYLPLFSEAELERRMHFFLWGTPWAGFTWHSWRRLSEGAMVALAAPITAVCIWNRCTSERQAWEYAVPGPD